MKHAKFLIYTMLICLHAHAIQAPYGHYKDYNTQDSDGYNSEEFEKKLKNQGYGHNSDDDSDEYLEPKEYNQRYTKNSTKAIKGKKINASSADTSFESNSTDDDNEIDFNFTSAPFALKPYTHTNPGYEGFFIISAEARKDRNNPFHNRPLEIFQGRLESKASKSSLSYISSKNSVYLLSSGMSIPVTYLVECNGPAGEISLNEYRQVCEAAKLQRK